MALSRKDSLILACLALLAAPSCGPSDSAEETGPPDLPDIVLITADTLRADHLGAYGYFRNTTPRLDELAAESILFERLIAPMATTLPTHASLLTATYPEEHGILANVAQGGQRFVASKALESFAHFVRSKGMQTAAFVSATPLKPGTGIERGFTTFEAPEGREQRAVVTTDQALVWLQDHGDSAPFFLWVHYFDPHAPYDPPKPYRKWFQSDAGLEAYLKERQFSDIYHKEEAEPVDARESINLYDGEVRYLDDQVGRLLDQIRGRDRWDRTVVLFVADHGEGLCQHGELRHGLVWDEQLHVPWFLSVPGEKPRRVSTVASMVDVLPTLLALQPLPGHEEWLAQCSGRDVLAASLSPQPVLSQTSARREEMGTALTHTLTTDRFKYILQDDGKELLFELSDDPYELRPVQERYPKIVEGFRKGLQQMVQQQRRRGEELRSGELAPHDPDVLDQLRELGYVEEE